VLVRVQSTAPYQPQVFACGFFRQGDPDRGTVLLSFYIRRVYLAFKIVYNKFRIVIFGLRRFIE